MRKFYFLGMILCCFVCVFFSGCSKNKTDESEKNAQPTTITQTLNADIANDYLILSYTTSLQDHPSNKYMKVVEYTVSVFAEDEEYEFVDASIKIEKETFEIDEKGCAEFTYSKNVSAIVTPIAIPELTISDAEGKVTRPNKSFKLNYFVDDEVVRSETIPYGQTPTYEFIPTKNNYYFVKWNKLI
jgi:hypothetical protein